MDKDGVAANSQLTLEDFQSQVAFDLVNIGKLTVASASKRGRPSSFTPPPKKGEQSGLLSLKVKVAMIKLVIFPLTVKSRIDAGSVKMAGHVGCVPNVEYTSAL